MIELNQYLIPALIGAAIGIWLVLSIVKAVIGGAMMNGGMMNGGGGYYHGQYQGGGALAAVFGFAFILLIIISTVYLSDQVQNGDGPLSSQEKQRERTWVDKLQDEERLPAPETDVHTPDWQEGLLPASTQEHQPAETQAIHYADIIPTSFDFNPRSTRPEADVATKRPIPKEERYYASEENFYIQVGAGSDETAALATVRRLQHLPGQVWLGVKETDTDLFKFLVGPFSGRQSAKAAQRRWNMNGYVRDASQDGIEVFSVN